MNVIYIGRAKNWQKVAYLRRNPSPICKMENDRMNDMARC